MQIPAYSLQRLTPRTFVTQPNRFILKLPSVSFHSWLIATMNQHFLYATPRALQTKTVQHMQTTPIPIPLPYTHNSICDVHPNTFPQLNDKLCLICLPVCSISLHMVCVRCVERIAQHSTSSSIPGIPDDRLQVSEKGTCALSGHLININVRM